MKSRHLFFILFFCLINPALQQSPGRQELKLLLISDVSADFGITHGHRAVKKSKTEVRRKIEGTKAYASHRSNFFHELRIRPQTARSHLRQNLGSGYGQAHHVIPWSLRSHPLIEKAAKSGFNINGAENGIRLTETQHNGPHQRYNLAVKKMLDKMHDTHPSASAKESAEMVNAYVHKLKQGLQKSQQAT